MSKPSPRTFDNSLKWITFFYTLNWICDGIPAAQTKGLTFQCGTRWRVLSTKIKICSKFCFKKKPFAVYIRVPKALGIFFGGALVDGTEVFWLKKNGFIDGSPGYGDSNGELRRSGEAMHAGKINPARRCGGFILVQFLLGTRFH